MLAQLSDPHLGADPVHGEARLAAAVAAVAALEPAPDAVLVSGDLTDHGTATEYARVRALLAPLRMPKTSGGWCRATIVATDGSSASAASSHASPSSPRLPSSCPGRMESQATSRSGPQRTA